MSNANTTAATEFVACDACGTSIPAADTYTDSDGFTACRPAFPVAIAPAGSEQFLEGPCAQGRPS